MTRPAKLWLLGLTGVFLLYVLYSVAVSYSARVQIPSQPHAYNPKITCDETKDIDHQFDGDKRSFDVILQPKCFSGWVTIPQTWPDWHYQPKGDQAGWWVAFWYPAPAKPTLAYFPNSISETGRLPRVFRTQGVGVIRFYTNEPPEKIQPPLLPLPKPGQTPGTNVVEPEGHQPTDRPFAGIETSKTDDPTITPPILVHKVEAEYTNEARKAVFNGNVSVSIVVDEHGFVQDIVINNPPGYGLDEAIKKALPRWEFKPATRNGKPIPFKATISINFHSG